MTSKNQQTTKYPGVFKDLKSGYYFYQTEFGVDGVTGKRIRKKARKDRNGKNFTTASEANKELVRVKREWNGNSFFDKFYKVQNFFPYAIPIVLDNEPPRM